MITATPVNHGQFSEGSKIPTPFSYAHGLLEDELGYDLLHMSSDIRGFGLPKEGVFTVDVKGYGGSCWAWVWVPKYWSEKVCLVVDVADVESMDHARDCYMNKKSI